jgi:hypothetical protein
VQDVVQPTPVPGFKMKRLLVISCIVSLLDENLPVPSRST